MLLFGLALILSSGASFISCFLFLHSSPSSSFPSLSVGSVCIVRHSEIWMKYDTWRRKTFDLSGINFCGWADTALLIYWLDVGYSIYMTVVMLKRPPYITCGDICVKKIKVESIGFLCNLLNTYIICGSLRPGCYFCGIFSTLTTLFGGKNIHKCTLSADNILSLLRKTTQLWQIWQVTFVFVPLASGLQTGNQQQLLDDNAGA